MKFATINALHNRNYRFYFFGQFLSMSGTFLQNVALSWLVYRLSGSATWLGIISFTTQIPAFIFSPFAGVFADRIDRRKILVWVQILSMLQAFTLSLVVFFGKTDLFLIAGLSACLGVINAFDMTGRQAFVFDMVGRENLESAISLNSIVMNGARVIGPALAGVLISSVGEKWCFLLNGLSYVAALASLMSIHTLSPKPTEKMAGIVESIREGVKYTFSDPFIRAVTVRMVFVSFTTPAIVVLLPAFAKTILKGSAHTYAALISTLGIGAIIGIFFAGNDRTNCSHSEGRVQFEKTLMKNIAGIGLAFIVFALSRNFWLSMASMFFIGLYNMAIYPRMNTAIQQVVEDRIRGRVMSIYLMAFLGITPLASLLAGAVADTAGPSITVAASGIICIIASVLMSRP